MVAVDHNQARIDRIEYRARQLILSDFGPRLPDSHRLPSALNEVIEKLLEGRDRR